MCPPAVSPLFDINNVHSTEELFAFVCCMARAEFVPAHVITDVNPFTCLPETLPENVWYFMNPTESKGADGGFWKPRGQPREIFGDDSINGWEATHEFYKGQGPHVEKTNWLMLEYYITSKVSGEALSAKDAKSLCKVFRSGSLPLSDSEMLQNVAGTEFRRENYVYSLPPDNFNIPTEQYATNQMQVDTTSCNLLRCVSSFRLRQPVENLPELDDFGPDDCFSLLDLDFTRSPSSPSENSSCVTMLSEECFNFLDAMLDLEAESGDHAEHKDADCYLSISDFSKPDDIVVQAAISGLPIEERSSENARDGKAVDSSPPCTLDSQSSSGSNSSQALSPGPDGRAEADGTSEKLQKKCMCFMPF
ncbi:hypothetical protein BT93_F0396 [Corymbia citriodora subsp. variegata]|nr:hypothetical protein BT93_F0396 [Corymbia citriodora subsp. variegata]